MRLLRFVAEAHTEIRGRRLVINGAGAGGALLIDLGVPPGSVRGFVLIARSRGARRGSRGRSGTPDRLAVVARSRRARAAFRLREGRRVPS